MTQNARGVTRSARRNSGIGWNDQPERLRGYIRRMCKADDVRFLTPQQASIIIDGLTAMRDGDRSERKA